MVKARKWESVLVPVAVILVFGVYFFRFLCRNLAIPFWDAPTGGDSILQASFIKTLIETGWVLDSPRMGAPFGANFADFPGADGTLLVLAKILTWFSSDATVVMSLFYLSSFMLVYFVAYWVLRQFEISVPWAAAGAIVYACAPYHFMRGMNHLYLSNYFVVPLWTWLSIKVFQHSGARGQEPIFRHWWTCLVALVVAGTSGVYYAFFGLVSVTVCAVLGAVENRRLIVLRHWVPVVAIVCAAALLNIAPSFIYWHQFGANASAAVRTPFESDFYGLRIIQMLLPVPGHQNVHLARFSDSFGNLLRPVTEASSSSLGMIGSLGFVLLVLSVFLGNRLTEDSRILALGKLNLAMLLFTTVGGFGVLFAMLVTPQFRGLNRASIFIAFFALLGLFLLVKGWVQAGSWQWATKRWLQYALAAAVAGFAIYDQVPLGARPLPDPAILNPANSAGGVYSVGALKQLIDQMEAKLPKGSMVYLMPYLPFPESPTAYQEGYNALLRPYYYSTTLRWSYGAMKGRMGDAWLQAVDALPISDKLSSLRKTGFRGIFIDRKAYRDNGAQLESQLASLADGKALESADHRYVFFPLEPDVAPVVTPSIMANPGLGFYSKEQGEGTSWFWSDQTGQYQVWNFTDRPIQAVLHGALQGLGERVVTVSAGAQQLATLELKTNGPLPLTLPVVLQPGLNRLTFRSDAPAQRVPNDPRALAFRFVDPNLSIH